MRLIKQLSRSTGSFLSLALIVLFTAHQAAGAEPTFYVATNGDDNNAGTRQRPFATPARARDVVRKAKKTAREPITVYLRGGTYYLHETLVFGPKDSGTAEAPITYAAYKNEKPIISGGRKIQAKWKPYRDGIYMCSLAGTQLADKGFGQLFVDGKRQIRARYPNGDPTDPRIEENFTYLAGADEWPHKEVYYDPDEFTTKKWARPKEAVLHIFGAVNWSTRQFRLAGIDYDRCAIKLGEGGWQQHERFPQRPGTKLNETCRFYIENVFEELDAPREWYFDNRKKILYYKPPDKVDLNNATVEAVLLKNLVEFRGSKENPVHHINLRGLRITQSATTFLEKYSIPSMGDWAIHRGGAVFFDGAEDCSIDNCFFDAVGGNAVFINYYNRRIHIESSLFTEIGESAICLVGKSMLSRDLSYDCPYCGTHHDWGFLPHTDQYAEGCVVKNNLIHDVGIFGKQTAGVFMAVSAKNIISHNEMYNIPRAAICIHDGTYGGHIIEYNDLHHTCRETGEHGTFNSWGRDSWWCQNQSHGRVGDISKRFHPAGDVLRDAKYTTIIRNNRFRDEKGWGIDLDDGSSNYHIYNNLCIGVAIKLREGDLRTVENNIVITPARPPGIQVGCENNSDRIIGNIIVGNTAYDKIEPDGDFKFVKAQGGVIQFTKPPQKGRWIKEIDYNTYFSDVGKFIALPGNMDFEQWRAKGFGLHSVYADPMFVNPAKADYRVKPGSPALKLGFKNFPMDQFGLLPEFPEKWRADEPKLPMYAGLGHTRGRVGRFAETGKTGRKARKPEK